MATETGFHRTDCNNGWSSLEIESENQSHQAEPVTKIGDHGSISFGRFAAESLSWERWSVFSHNRCQEELEKFKEPGFVAQKKAYFEEYYGRIRAMKASQAEQQDTTGFGRFRQAKSCIAQVDTSNDSASLKGEMKSTRVGEIPTLEGDANAKSNSSLEGTVEKQEAASKENLSDWSSNNEKDSTTDATETDQSIKEASMLHPSFARKSGISQRENLLSNSVKRTANKPKDEGNEGSGTTRERSKIGSRNTKDGVKSSENRKPSPYKKITAKTESSIVLGKNSNQKVENGNASIHVLSHRQLTEACSRSTVRHTSLARNKLVTSSSPVGIIGQKKTNSSGKDLGDKFRRSPPGSLQSSQCSSKETVSGGSEQKGTHRRLKNLQPPRNYDIERKQKEGEDKTSITTGRGSKSPTTTPTSSHKNLKMIQKNTLSQPKNLAHARKEPRVKIPSWR